MNKFPIEPFLYHDNSTLNINCKSLKDLLKLRSHQLTLPHKISFYAIHLFEKGNGIHSLDHHHLKILPKHILIATENQINQFHEPLDCSGKILIFTENFFCLNDYHFQFLYNSSLLNNIDGLTYFDVSSRYDELLMLFKLIEQELMAVYHTNQKQILNNYLFNILLILENLYKPQNKNLNIQHERLIVSKFKSFVKSNINKEFTIKKYALILGFSIRSIENAFKKVENKTPYNWISEHLILQIKRDLIYKNLQIDEIAYQLGFKESNHLIKFFKKHTGITPLQFRKSYFIDGS